MKPQIYVPAAFFMQNGYAQAVPALLTKLFAGCQKTKSADFFFKISTF
jgi:hypothetical protein